MHCRCDLRAGLDNYIFYIYSSFTSLLPCRIQWSTQFVRRQQKQTGMRTLDDTFILGEIQPLFKAWIVSEICVFRSGSTDFNGENINDTLPNCTRAAELAFVALNFWGAEHLYFHNRLRDKTKRHQNGWIFGKVLNGFSPSPLIFVKWSCNFF